MDRKLKEQLVQETSLEDIEDKYKPVVEIIGIEKFLEIAEYAQGVELYFPKTDSIIKPARNRRIEKEYNGYNIKDLAERYDLTIKQVAYILRNVPHPGQMDIFSFIDDT